MSRYIVENLNCRDSLADVHARFYPSGCPARCAACAARLAAMPASGVVAKGAAAEAAPERKSG